MSTRTAADTSLIRVISLLYAMNESDQDALRQQLVAQMTAAYRQTIQAQLNLYRCQQIVSGPDTSAQRWIGERASADAQRIAATYNRELANQVQALYRANPRGNRQYYYSNLERWAQRRNLYKLPSIALNTMTASRDYAAQRFRDENAITGRFIFVGPPPVCRRCVTLKGLGAVSAQQAKAYGNSQHVNCPHRWEQVIPQRIDCDSAWTG